ATASPSSASTTTSTRSATRARTRTSRSPRARSTSRSGPSSAGSTAARSRSRPARRSSCRRPGRCPSTTSGSTTARSWWWSTMTGSGHVLEIRGLRAAVGGTEILRGVTLTVRSGEVHAVMGPNGSGKSTLSYVLMGKPGYEVTGGSVTLDGVDLLAASTWERAQAGLYLAMQYPIEVPGVRTADVLAEAFAATGRDPVTVGALLESEADRIGFSREFLSRPLNVDLSGGEKKRNETVQLAVLRPGIAILDEL